MTDPKPLSEMELAKLARLAKAATAGPWELVRDDDNAPYGIFQASCENPFEDSGAAMIVDAKWRSATDEGQKNYRYIAACSPDIIKRLISMARK